MPVDEWEAGVRAELSDEAYKLCCGMDLDRPTSEIIEDIRSRQHRVWSLLQSACSRMLASSSVEEAGRESHRVRALTELVPLAVNQRAMLVRLLERSPHICLQLEAGNFAEQLNQLAEGVRALNTVWESFTWIKTRRAPSTWFATTETADLRVDEFTGHIDGECKIGDRTWGRDDFKTVDDAKRWCEESAIAGRGVER